jgi:hypothetical protein
MEWIAVDGLRIGRFPALGAMAAELSLHVAARPGGASGPPFESLNLGGSLGDRVSNIRENRRRLLAALGIPARRLARAGQIHGAEIAIVSRGGLYRGVDGFATRVEGLALAISTADCYPLVIYSPPERALAALHVGRMGARRGIAGRAVKMLRDRCGVEPAYAIAAIGPGICASCYTVERNEAMRFPRAVRRFAGGAWHLDLEAHVVRSLLDQGLERNRILSAGLCTACNPDLFFSHRRDGGVTGRHWTVAVIRPPGSPPERWR